MVIELKLINKVINENCLHELTKYNITENDFTSCRDMFKFVKDFKYEYGEMPSFTAMVEEFEDFDFMPDVTDNLAYLCKKLKQETAKIRAYKLIQNEVANKFAELDGVKFVNWLHGEVSQLKELSIMDNALGTNFATNGDERAEWYRLNKEQRTFKYIPTPYKTLTKYLGGGFELGDYLLIMAYTNRGKSWLGSDIGVTAWANNFGVLHYSPELSKEQQLQRLDTLHGKFTNSALKSGDLYNEDNYFRYLEKFNPEDQDIPYMVKTMEDLKNGLSIDVIEADLQANDNIKMVIIDGFNLMNHKGKSSNRDAMTSTSRKLRQVFGKYGVVGVVIHQTPTSAEKENRVSDEDTGIRIPKPPELHQYSETVAVIQDACTILTFDQADGIGKLKLAKTRTPNVDKELTLQCDFNRGIIKEASAIDYI
jgi:replicative DNA helicase